jgi:tyrocidine synthetase-3
VEEVVITRDASRNPLFDTMFVMQNFGIPGIEIPGLKLTPYKRQEETSKFDLTLMGMEVEERLLLTFEYSTHLFKKVTIERFVTYLKKIISTVAANPDVKICDVDILSDEEKRQVLYDFNNTAARYPKDKFLPQLFEKQAEKTPDNIAVVGPAEIKSRSYKAYISYRELNNKSNQLAYLLQVRGVKPDSIIGIMEERSLEMILGILAILKASGVYLPIDPAYPSERKKFMLDDCSAYALLTSSFLLEGSDFEFKGEIFSLDDVGLYSDSGKKVDGGIKSETVDKVGKPAYIMYTSGSTGRPKGVVVEHRNVVRLVVNTNYVELTAETRILQTGAPVFDATTFEIWGVLLNGGQLVLVEKETILETHRLGQALERNRINTLWLTSSLFNQLASENHEIFSTLEYLLVGGDVLSPGFINLVRANNKVLKIINGYGPTENTTFSTTFLIDKNYEQAIPIGSPINNSTAFILDRYGKLQPIGILGELYLGGDGVSKGYLNNPELTAEKFVELKVKADIHHKYYRSYMFYLIYKTGDMARWHTDGNIEFSGRMDHQVKIRGFRIEISEIENYLLKHQDIKEVIVVVHKNENEDKYLCAYFVSDHELAISQLRNYLSKDLPGYMIPSYFVPLEALPLTPNGKVDRKALPKPEKKGLAGHYIAPRNLVEKRVVEIWSEVLGIKKEVISTDSNFFHLGGHSLKAAVLIAKIHKTLNVKVPLAEVFKTPRIRELAQYIKGLTKDKFLKIEPVEKKDYYRLSSAQKRLYFLHQMDPDSTAYNIPSAVILEGVLDKAKLEGAFKKLIHRHESFRTSFIMVKEEAVQLTHDEVEFGIEYHQSLVGKEEHSSLSSPGRGEVSPPIEIKTILREFIHPFDLTQAPLMRVGLIKLQHTFSPLRGRPSPERKEDKYLLMVDMHHIISDGISRRIFVSEFMALAAGKDLPPLRLQYKDFSQWQNSEAQREALIKQKAYWEKQLEGEIPVLDLPVDYIRPKVQRYEGSTVVFEIGQEEVNALQLLALEEGMTLYMILLGIYYILLAKLSNQEDILVGTPTAGRPHADLEQIIGMFVNTLVLRNYPRGEQTYREFLTEIKKRSLDAFENQDYPYEELVEVVAITRDASRNPLFDTMFVLENQGMSQLEIAGLKMSPHEHPTETSKFDLSLIGVELEEKMRFMFEYSTNLFKVSTIKRFITYFRKILSIVVENPGVKIGDVEILLEEERREILYDFNNTKADYPKDKVLHCLFEEQVSKNPDHIAVVSTGRKKGNHHPENGQQHICCRDLNRKANQLAYLLMEKGSKPDSIIGIMEERSQEMILGILAILKAGGVYLPIDPDYPSERKTFMLDDSNAHVLLTSSSLMDGSDFKFKGEIFPLDDMGLYSDSGKDSGSTGRPKGVLVQHRNVIRLVVNTNYVELTAGTRILQTGAPVFDATTFETWGALLNGGQLVLVEKETILEAHRLGQALKRNKINTLWLTSPLFNQLAGENHEIFSSLDYLLVGGDVLSPAFINLVRDKNKALKIINGYGPTENTTFSTTFQIDKNFEQAIPIGRPINNSTAFILDRYGRLQPVGIFGELWVGGDGVSRGYINNPELTDEKFGRAVISVSSPVMGSSPGLFPIDQRPITNDRLYRTGDIVRWLPDGNIEFSGRIDYQVKIRGFRIELSEIENELLKHPDIDEAIVIADQDDNEDKYLCGYFVSDHEVSTSQLRNYLSKELPGYMIPSYFVSLEVLPLTPNGKVDRKALPKPDKKDFTGYYLPPQNLVEKKLVEIWSEVLGIHKDVISMDSNFFQLGGHSLKATILISKIHKKLNVKVPLAEIFKRPVIRELCQYIAAEEKGLYASIEKAEKQDYYRLSSAQKRLYLLHQIDSIGTAYNIPAAFILEGVLEKGKLEGAFEKLIQRHESFRTSFHMIDDMPVQRIHQAVPFGIEYDDSSFITHNYHFIRPFDLSRAPLFRVSLIKTAENGNKYIFTVDMHHIISDGTSMGVLVKEFMRLYNGEELLPLRIQYKDFSRWQNSKEEQESIRRQEMYWLKEFAGEIPVLNLPIDFARPAIQDFTGGSLAFEIGKDETEKLKNMSLTDLLARISGQEEIVVGSPLAGRRHPDLEQIIGMFVNTLALKNYLPGEKKLKELIAEVKAKTLEGQENQDYPFETLVEKLTLTRDASRSPLFDVMFAMQNMDQPELRVPGLKLKPYPYDEKKAKFDLIFTCKEEEEELLFSVDYCVELFKEETVKCFVGYFKRIISTVLQNPGLPISEIEILSGTHKRKVLHDFNAIDARFPVDKRMDQLFEQQADRTPDNISLDDMRTGSQLTFGELKKKSRQLAHFLGRQGTGPGQRQLVGLLVKGSIEMIIAILGILKAGCGYVPLNPKAPPARNRYILEECDADILLIDGSLPGGQGLDEWTGQKIFLPVEAGYGTEPFPCPSPDICAWGRNTYNPDLAANPAYVMFTSGSTGQPKGVVITHANMSPLLHWGYKHMGLTSADRTLQNLSYYFDWSVWEIFITLTSGASLCLAAEQVIVDPEVQLQALRKNVVTVLHITPTHFQTMIGAAEREGGETPALDTLKFLAIGAEKLTYDLVKRACSLVSDDCRLFNMYGPTEATIMSAVLEIYKAGTGKYQSLTSIPIGRTLANADLLVLDRYLALCPVKVTGELYIAGDGLASGYLNDQEKTAAAFVKNIFKPEGIKGEHLYKTGDLVRWLENGEIEYLGRFDHQVKIRGYRIELGEIEKRLLDHETVKDAQVMVRHKTGEDKYLCAYIVPREKADMSELRNFIARHLPQYMIPSYFVSLDEMPLTPNGKVDRRALPEPELQVGESYTAPGDEIEKKLVEIWSVVLGIEKEKIGINDNFFHMGGHSLKATILSSRIQQTFNVHLPLGEIFKQPVIRELSTYIKEASEDRYLTIEVTEKKDYYTLSSAQKRLFFLDRLQGNTTPYNLPAVLRVEGELDRFKLKQVFDALIRRHESLRTSFRLLDGEPVQVIHESRQFDLTYMKIGEESIRGYIDGFIQPFNLDRAPLMRVGLVDFGIGQLLLLFDMHHIISDGISEAFLVREFLDAYQGKMLPVLSIQYKDYSQWHHRLLDSDGFKKQEEYWLSQFKGELSPLELPTDYPRPSIQSFEGNRVAFHIDSVLSEKMRTIVSDLNTTLYTGLLAVYYILLSRYTGQEDIFVGIPTAGRNRVDIERIIGLFVNTLPVRNYPRGEKTFISFLEDVKVNLLEAYEYQDYPFDVLVDKLDLPRDYSRNPVFDVLFVSENVDIPELEVEGLKLVPYEFKIQTTHLDLVLYTVEVNDKVTMILEYSAVLFEHSTAEKMAQRYVEVLKQVANNKDIRLKDIKIATSLNEVKLKQDFKDFSAFDF